MAEQSKQLNRTSRLIPREAGMARRLPSGTQLPKEWNEAHDRFICHCDASGYLDPASIVRALKKKFPELQDMVITPEALQRRIECLDNQENDYFVAGMETAVERLEDKGFVFPPMDFEKYAKPPAEIDEDPEATNLRVFGYDEEGLKKLREEAERVRPGPLYKGSSGEMLSGGPYGKPTKKEDKKTNAADGFLSKLKSKFAAFFKIGRKKNVSANESSSAKAGKVASSEPSGSHDK